jgi:hypothetical protein
MPTDTPTTPAPILIDAAAVCAALSIGQTSLKKLIRTGRLPLRRYRLLRKVLFSRDELQRWVAAGLPPASRWSFLQEQAGLRKTG